MRPLARWRALLLAVAAALLAACSMAPERPATPAPKIEPPPPPANPAPATPAPGEIAPPKPHANVEIVSPWQTLRDSFAMKSCDYRPQVVRWAKRYTASPRHFTAGWERAMPFLEIVVE